MTFLEYQYPKVKKPKEPTHVGTYIIRDPSNGKDVVEIVYLRETRCQWHRWVECGANGKCSWWKRGGKRVGGFYNRDAFLKDIRTMNDEDRKAYYKSNVDQASREAEAAACKIKRLRDELKRLEKQFQSHANDTVLANQKKMKNAGF